MSKPASRQQLKEVQNRDVVVNAKPKFDLGERVNFKWLSTDGIATVTQITICIVINSGGIREEIIRYNLRYPVREMSNDYGFTTDVPENKLTKL